MIDLGELFPKAMGRPITVNEAIKDIFGSFTNSSFIWKRQIGKPFQTFTKTKSKSHQVFTLKGDRFLTEKELKIGASFPIKYKFTSYEKAINRIGNSVPPLLVYAIAAQIKHKLWGGDKLKPMNKNIDYPTHLEMMWKKHLEPRQPDAPTVISTFAGGGGSSLGYSMAGYRELLAVEWDNNAVETFKLNFPDVPVYHGDIAKLSVDECLELAGVKPGELDILDGSPPCQGFSTAGKRNLDDPRNQLFREYVRLLQGLKPKVFVMENVSGMVKGKMKLVFAEILRELRGSGYKVSARLLNAMYFHVPQSRQRMIFIGVREDLGIEPSYPKAESRPVTVREAWNGCEDKNGKSISKNASLIYRKTPQGKTLDVGAKEFQKRSYFTHRRLSFSNPANTISKSIGSLIYHPEDERGISIGELKRIASYPDKYLFTNHISQAWERIGNSVPPLMMEAIARNTRLNILGKIQ